jgi:hypothetical protein
MPRCPLLLHATNKKMTIERQSRDNMRTLADACWGGAFQKLLECASRFVSMARHACHFFWPPFAHIPIAYAREALMRVSLKTISKMPSQQGNKPGHRPLL